MVWKKFLQFIVEENFVLRKKWVKVFQINSCELFFFLIIIKF